MGSVAGTLARWAYDLVPTPEDLALAQRSLIDTAAVALAARDHPIRPVADTLPDVARWATLGHVLDFDDLHLPSTAHISVVCVPAVLGCGGDARAYLAAAGVMARLGTALGWDHYERGWHATCTAGAPAAAVGAAVALGLPPDGIAHAIALAVPAAGGVQRAFGTPAKALQVGFAAEAGVRAARLVSAGATADPIALEQWLRLVGGDPDRVDVSGSAVPGGLAIKLYPCCYALQRPISAVRQLAVAPEQVRRIRVSTPAATTQPLIHHRPTTGLQGKFSLEYGVVAALLDDPPGFASFTTEAVTRTAVADLVERVDVALTPGGDWLLAGQAEVEVVLADGSTHTATLDLPPGSPQRPPSAGDLTEKLRDCGDDVPGLLADLDWAGAAKVLP